MARKLKTYTTSAGFFDLAVAAPSMKAALDAWGSKMNLFHQGLAKATDAAEVVAATLAKPGVVLRRPIGSDEPFSEHPGLPRNLAPGGPRAAPTAAPRNAPQEPPAKPAKPPKVDAKAAREANRAYEREQKRREAERRREEAAEAKRRERRERAIAAAEAALQQAEREHEAALGALEQERAALDRRSEAERERWHAKKQKLEADLRQARAAP